MWLFGPSKLLDDVRQNCLVTCGVQTKGFQANLSRGYRSISLCLNNGLQLTAHEKSQSSKSFACNESMYSCNEAAKYSPKP